MSVMIGPYTEGEIPPPIVIVFKDSGGTPLNFSANGPWTAKWIIRLYGGVVQTKPATAPAANDGKVTYPWVAGDIQPGDWEAEMWVGNGINRYASVKYVYAVRPALAVPTI